MPPRKTSIKQVRTFPQLVKYLRDELDWPIESDNYDEISWEYDPEELGLKPHEAAKIDYIRQMRPLTDKQPFGIFFVKFSKGKLPVVALRRILSNLVVKRRASANRADRPAWEMNDLLFLSSWGEKEQRHMNFAHFADNDTRRDLPTLKVLDWGQHNTKLHVRDVEQRLRQNLAWPEDTAHPDQWREIWRGAFRLRHRETIETSKDLSIRLAELARAIRDHISDALAIETDKGPLTTLLKAFQQGLVHDLDADGFADMYAQTIAYGLLSARIADPKKKTADDFAAHMRTSPFLRELMETFLAVGGRKGKAGGPGIDFDELGVSDVVELLDEANMEAVVRDFGDKNRQEDPVIHFYELFLHEYNKQLKIQRGVFYTPQPVVSYIVRSVHELLQTEFGLADGLADTTTWAEMLKQHKDLKLPPLTDEPGEKRAISPKEPFVQILDPATGTATFLVEVIDVIHNTMTAKWKQQGKKAKAIDTLWNDYVPQHLLPRLHAYELMMAPYAIAHMKVGLKLAETGYRFEAEERARIYLTNALEPWQKQLKLPAFDALAHEAAAVNEIKRDKRFTVVIGNPPYAGVSSNMSAFAQHIVDAYRIADGVELNERKIWLQDDYVKFFRKAQTIVDSTGVGVLGYITNHGYLDNPTFRGMRQSLMASFHQAWTLDLHGNTNKKETAPNGAKDENVFDIMQGVAVGLFVSKAGCTRAPLSYSRADLYGARESKYLALSNQQALSQRWTPLTPNTPHYFFSIRDETYRGEYEQWPLFSLICPENVTGIVTSRDDFATDFDRDALLGRITAFERSKEPSAGLLKKFGLKENYAWRVKQAQAELQTALKSVPKEQLIHEIAYRVFDIRFIFYEKSVVWRTRINMMRHLHQGKNIGIALSRQLNGDFRHVFCSRTMPNFNFLDTAGRFGAGPFFPLYCYPRTDMLDGISLWPGGEQGRYPNLAPRYMNQLQKNTGAKFIPDGPGDLEQTFGPENVFCYAYAVFHSPGYRSRYAEFLKIDFPRLPLSGSLKLFRALIKLGEKLTALHLLESPNLKKPTSKFIGKNTVVSKVGWTPDGGGTVWIDGKGAAKNFQPGTNGFRPVPEEVWNFHIGGYKVCEKWLKDRGPKKGKPGRTLSKDDIAHYHKIVIALTETIRIMAEIDEVIEQHGGWPDAFATQTEKLAKVAEDAAGYDT